jgi:type IV pilus assembly protein PilE
MSQQKGFTLLEVLIVVIIIGILASISFPQYVQTLIKAKTGESIANLGAVRSAIDRYWYQNSALPTSSNFDGLDIDDPNDMANRLWDYTFTSGNSTTRTYNVTATYRKDSSYWVRWVQVNSTYGNLTRCATLGGPTAP